MLECLLFGDDLVGNLDYFLPTCDKEIYSELNSEAIFSTHVSSGKRYKTTIVSLGYNDLHIDTEYYADELRKKMTGMVIWLLSEIRQDQYDAIVKVAQKYNDKVLFTGNYEHDYYNKRPSLVGYQKIKSHLEYLEARNKF